MDSRDRMVLARSCWLMLVFSSMLILSLTGCFYSFRGTSVPPHMKTIAIPVFDDQSGLGQAGLRDKFTRDLTQLFVNDNTLQVTDRNSADALLEGSISTIQDQAAVVAPGEEVKKRRITVTVHVVFQDLVQHKKVWEKDISNWGEYDSGGGLSQREVGISDALQKVSEDILIATVSGW
jgi:outer membrane lipopolysaccharide assembly protein LptE/RlpB